MAKKYCPVPLTPSEVVEALATASLALRYVAETRTPPGTTLGDTQTHLRHLTQLRERVKEHGLPPSLAGRAARRRGG